VKKTVSIIRNAENGNGIITAYEKSPEYGYIHLQASVTEAAGGWLRTSTRATLLRAKVLELQAFVKAFATGDTLPGIIVVREFTESGIAGTPYAQRLDKNVPYEKAIDKFIKRTGKDGIDLMCGDERILRFTDYVMNPADTDVDVLIPHTNIEEVAAWNAARKAAKTGAGADLDNGGN
jgi:hypothetical protein